MTHGISRGYDHFKNPQVLFDHLKDASQLQDSLWIATFHDVSAYVTERDFIRLGIKERRGKIIVTPQLGLDKRIFVMPLSLLIPQTVKKAMQGKRKLEIHSKNGAKYVDINPFGKKVKLIK